MCPTPANIMTESDVDDVEDDLHFPGLVAIPIAHTAEEIGWNSLKLSESFGVLPFMD